MNQDTCSLNAPSTTNRYKYLLRTEIQRFRQAKGPAFTQSALALKLGIEASYLSRCLNHSGHHPSRELCFRILTALETPASRIQEFLDAYDISQAVHRDYRRFLEFRTKVCGTHRSLKKLVSLRTRVMGIVDAIDELTTESASWNEEVSDCASENQVGQSLKGSLL